MRCISPCPLPLAIFPLRCSLSLHSTKLVDLGKVGLDSDNNENEGARNAIVATTILRHLLRVLCRTYRHRHTRFALGVVSLLFFFFTFCMLLEQTEAISTNVSKIARMKTRAGLLSRPGEYAPVATEFNEVFGGTHPAPAWHWLLPLQVRFPEWAWDNIMGYEFDATVDRAPYQEPCDTDAESVAGGSVRSGTSGGVSLGGGTGGEADAPGRLGGMDVETGGTNASEQEPLEQELLQEEEKDATVVSSMNLSDSGMKKRSTGSSLT